MILGKFITFEGGEGGGKSTQSSLLCKALQEAQIETIHTREPGGTEGAEAIRSLLVKGDVNRWGPMTELLLHYAARKDHVEKLIQPGIEQGKWVVCDRFVHSTMAYQGYGHQLGEELIRQVHNIVLGRIYPCLVFILDIDPTKGIGRAETRNDDENRYEKIQGEFHQRVRKGFLEMAKADPIRCVLVDATASIEAIHSQILGEVNKRFGLSLESALK